MIASVGRALAGAARSLRRNPGLSATAVLTLAIGIASPTAMFSVATGILGELPFEEPHELVEIEVNDLPAGRTNIGATLDDLAAWRDGQTSFDGIAALDRRVFQVGGDDFEPDRIRGAALTPDAFTLLGTAPALGRALVPADAAAGAPPVTVLGYEVWEDRFALDPNVLGTVMRLDGTARTVVGVMPEGFAFPRTEHLWIPLGRSTAAESARVATFGRLRDGVDPDAAQADLDVLAANLAAARPGTHGDLTISVHPFAHAELGDGEAALMLYAMTLVLAFILVVACVNVAHLLLARAVARSREDAVRLALGAGRARVLGAVLSESFLLAAGGGAAGIALAYATVAWLDARLGPVINLFWARIEVDAAVLAFVAFLVGVAGLLAGFLPARRAASTEVTHALKERDGAAGGLRSGRTARALIGVQIAFSCGLLILSGLMVRGVLGLASRDLGFDPEGVFTGRVELRSFDYPDAAGRSAFVQRLSEDLRETPGVESVAIASGMPGLGAEARSIRLEADPDGPAADVGVLSASDGFFSTFRTTLLSGRLFADRELESGRGRVAVVTDVFVQRFLPAGSAVGQRFRFDDDVDPGEGIASVDGMVSDAWIEVIGVVADAGVFREGETERPGVIVPLPLEAPRSLTIALRGPDAATASSLLRTAIRARDPGLPLFGAYPLDAVLRDATVVQRTFGALFGVFGLVALLMAVVGLYAVVAYGVKRRRREIGMRRALGARAADIVRLLVRDASVPLAGGLAVGTGFALLIAPALGAALFGTSPRDPLVYGLVIATLGCAALVAALLPAVSAVRIGPMRALRAE